MAHLPQRAGVVLWFGSWVISIGINQLKLRTLYSVMDLVVCKWYKHYSIWLVWNDAAIYGLQYKYLHNHVRTSLSSYFISIGIWHWFVGVNFNAFICKLQTREWCISNTVELSVLKQSFSLSFKEGFDNLPVNTFIWQQYIFIDKDVFVYKDAEDAEFNGTETSSM